MGQYDSFLDAPDAPAGKYDSFLDDAPAPKQNTSLAGDIGTGLKRGVLQMPGMVTGLADLATTPIALATGVNRPISKAADWAGEKTGFQPEKWAKNAEAEYSPEMQQAQANVEAAQGFFPTLGAVAENPRVAAQLVAESLPSTIAGGVLARGAMGAVMGAEKLAALRAAAGSADVAVANAAKAQLLKSGAIAAGIGEGAVTSGQQMSQTGYEVDPALAAGTALAAGIGTGVIGAGSGRLTNSAIGKRLGLSDLETSMAAGTLGENSGKAGLASYAKRIGAGTIQEGLLEEAPQSYQEQVWQNLASGKPWDEGAASAAAQGAIAGGLMGGAVNAIPRKSTPDPETPPAIPDPSTGGTFTPDPNGGVLERGLSAMATAQAEVDALAPRAIDTIDRGLELVAPPTAPGVIPDSELPIVGQPAPEINVQPIDTGETANQNDDTLREYFQAQRTAAAADKSGAVIPDAVREVAETRPQIPDVRVPVETQNTKVAPEANNGADRRVDMDLPPAVTQQQLADQEANRSTPRGNTLYHGGTLVPKPTADKQGVVIDGVPGVSFSPNAVAAARYAFGNAGPLNAVDVSGLKIYKQGLSSALDSAYQRADFGAIKAAGFDGMKLFNSDEHVLFDPEKVASLPRREAAQNYIEDSNGVFRRFKPWEEKNNQAKKSNPRASEQLFTEDSSVSPDQPTQATAAAGASLTTQGTTNGPTTTETQQAEAKRQEEQPAAPVARPASLPNHPAAKIVAKALPEAKDVQIHSTDSLSSEKESGATGRMSKWRGKTIERLAKVFGRKRVVFFSSANTTADGMNIGGGDTLYVNIDSGIDPIAVVGHEWRHALKTSNAAAHAAINQAATKLLDQPGRLLEFAKAYYSAELSQEDGGTQETKDRIARIESGEATDEDKSFLAEEFSADMTGNLWRDPEALREVFDTILEQHPPSAARTIIKSIVDALHKLIDKLIISTPKGQYSEMGISREELLGLKKEIQAAMADSFKQDVQRLMGKARGVKRSTPRELEVANTPTFKSDIPNERWLQEQVDYAQSKGKDRHGVPYMGKVTGRFSGNVTVPVSILSKLKGEKGEQNNVRQDDLESLTKMMSETGGLPRDEQGRELAPYIEVAYDGSAWVSEGNHRIMAAAALGMERLPAEIRYFDGGERKQGVMSPGNFTSKNPDIRFSPPRFFSQLATSIDQIQKKMETMPAAQWRMWLTGNAPKLGIKKDEIVWSGIDDYLSLRGKDKVTKAEVQQFLSENGTQVNDVVLGSPTTAKLEDVLYFQDLTQAEWDAADETQRNEWREEYASQSSMNPLETKFGQYVVPGGENYRELLITLPGKSELNVVPHPTKGGFALQYGNGAYVTSPDGGATTAQTFDPDKASQWDKKEYISAGLRSHDKAQFRSSHFDQPNIIVHLRMDERTDSEGDKVLFLNEIQSDWGQSGKKEGFAGADAKRANALEQKVKDGSATRAEFNELRSLQTQKKDGGVPSAPFVTDTKSWVALGLKRAIMYAVQNGMSKVAWATGEQNAAHYNLSKQVNEISWRTRKGNKSATIDLQNGDQLTFHLAAEGRVESIEGTGETRYMGKGFDEVIGKALAEKVMADEKGVVSGEGLNIGDEGMIKFYGYSDPNKPVGTDENGKPIYAIVTVTANDVLKKLGGGKVETIEVTNGLTHVDPNTGDKIGNAVRPQQGFTIPPSMAEKVQTEGVPLFSTPRAIPSKDLAIVPVSSFSYNQDSDNYYYHVTSSPNADKALKSGLHPNKKAMFGAYQNYSKGKIFLTERDGVMFWIARVEDQLFDRYDDPPEVAVLRVLKSKLSSVEPDDVGTQDAKHPAVKYSTTRYEVKRDEEDEGTFAVALSNDQKNRNGDPLQVAHLHVPDEAVSAAGWRIGDIQVTKALRRQGIASELVRRMSEHLGSQPIGAASVFSEDGKKFFEGRTRYSTARAQTETPEFKKWFGDSKVVDADGKPLVVYHGTRTDFNEFKEGEGISTDGGYLGAGFYFTPSTDLAGQYGRSESGANVMPVYLSLKNPLIFNGSKEIELLTELGGGPRPLDMLKEAAATSVWAKKVRAGLESLGYDGIMDSSIAEYATEIVVFKPTQIKSAIGNNGQFDAKNPDIRRSTARGAITNQPINQSWQDPDSLGKWDDFVRTMQDKLVDTKRVITAIHAAGVAIKDTIDPYLQEVLYHGRAAKRVSDFADTELRPMLVEMGVRKIERQELEDYLWARHATERNTQIAKINPKMPDGGSGLTNQQAADILSGQTVNIGGRDIKLNLRQMPGYRSLAAKIDAITKETTDTLVRYGLETQDTVDAWRTTYGKYVPLMRDMEADDNYSGAFNLGLGTGQGFSVRGSASKRALGSERGVIDILANVAMQRERAIVRGEKNRVAQSMYGLAITAPNPDFWLPLNPDAKKSPAQVTAELVALGLNPIDAANIANEPKQRYTDPNTGMVMERVNPQLRTRGDVLAVRINGKDRYVMFSSNERAQKMVAGLKNLDVDQMGMVMQKMAVVTRWFAAINTQYNPVFGLTNGIRDLGTGMLNLTSTELKGHQAEVFKNAFSALRGVYADLRNHRAGRVPTSRWALEFEEFALEGGQTGYRDMFQTSRERTEGLMQELKDATKGKTLLTFSEKRSPLFGWLSDYNTSIENAIRLSAYKAAKDKGMTKAQAANLAKNLTVNFNKKGLAATQLGAMYAFFNAAAQGTARIGQTLVKVDNGKFSLTGAGKKIVYGGMMAGVLQAAMFAAAGYDDEEPPQFIREKNFIIPLPEGKYLSVPYPLGFHVIPNIGRVASEFVLGGFKNPGKRMVDMFSMIMDGFNPIGGSSGGVSQMLSPTVTDPLVALSENKDWTGKSIYKEDFNSMHPTAGWTRKKDTASNLSRWLAYGINYLTGGGKYEIGLLSPTPDQLDYLIGQGTGGVGRESLKAWQFGATAATGENMPMYKVPISGRFVGETTGQTSETSKFYNNLKRIGEHKAALDEMQKARDLSAMIEYRKENPDAALVKQADKASTDISELKRRKRDMLEKGSSPEQIKLMEAVITTRVKRYNEMLSARS